MSTLIKTNNEYATWIKELSLRFRQSQIKAAVKVNTEMLRFYWSVGEDIANKKAESKWGEGFYRQLSLDLQNIFPEVKGFSIRNLQYMKKMYELFSGNAIFTPQLVAQSLKDEVCSIPWGNIVSPSAFRNMNCRKPFHKILRAVCRVLRR